MMGEYQENTYRQFADAAYSNPALDPKTAHLVKMAVAMSIGCYP